MRALRLWAPLGLLLSLQTACVMSADDYLKERPRHLPDAEVDAEVPDAALPVGPVVTDLRRIPVASVVEPRGLAHDGQHLFTIDRADDTLVRLDPASGAELDRMLLPLSGAIDLAALGTDTLLVAYVDTVFRWEIDAFTHVDGSFSELAGLTATADAVVTVQGSGLYVRERDSLASQLQLDYRGPSGPLVRLGADYLVYERSPRLDGVVFAARFTLADALSPTTAEVRGSVDLPVDVAHMTGAALLGDTLWLVGSGQGADVGQVVVVTLSPEPGR